MTVEELWNLRSHLKSAMNVMGLLLLGYEVTVALDFERDNSGLDIVATKVAFPSLLSNVL